MEVRIPYYLTIVKAGRPRPPVEGKIAGADSNGICAGHPRLQAQDEGRENPQGIHGDEEREEEAEEVGEVHWKLSYFSSGCSTKRRSKLSFAWSYPKTKKAPKGAFFSIVF